MYLGNTQPAATVQCDPFWSEMNGACSDWAGNYINRAGQVLDPITAKPRDSASAGIPQWAIWAAAGFVVFNVLSSPVGRGR